MHTEKEYEAIANQLKIEIETLIIESGLITPYTLLVLEALRFELVQKSLTGESKDA